MPFPARIALPLGLLLLGVGCASAARNRLIEQRTQHYVFHHSSSAVMAQAQDLLEQEAFELKPSGHPNRLRTEWKPVYDGGDLASTWDRYLVAAKPLTGEHCQLMVIRLTRSTLGLEASHPSLGEGNDPMKGGGGEKGTASGDGKRPNPMGPAIMSRDYQLEWKLIQRLEPQRAKQIEAEIAYQLKGATARR